MLLKLSMLLQLQLSMLQKLHLSMLLKLQLSMLLQLQFVNVAPTLGVDPGVRCHRIKEKPPMYIWSKYKCFLARSYLDMKILKQNYHIFKMY